MKTISLFLLLAIILVPFRLIESSNLPDCDKLEGKMRNAIGQLGPGTSFVFVDLGISQTEWDMLDQLKLIQFADYNRYGSLDNLEEELIDFLQQISHQDEHLVKGIAQAVTRVSKAVVKSSDKNYAWVCLSAKPISSKYDCPKWHINEAFYQSQEPISFKFISILKGPPILFYQPTEEERNLFNTMAHDRNYLNQLFDLKNCITHKKTEGMFYIVADKTLGAIHSEPKRDEERLSLYIVVGDKSEIQELYLNKLRTQ